MLAYPMVPPVTDLLARLDCPEPSTSSVYSGHAAGTASHQKKKPKLVLQTSSLSANYGVSSTTRNAAVNLTSTATPTTLNTFTNTFDLSFRPSPNSTTASPARCNIPASKCSSPFPPEKRCSSNLPYGIKPILKNYVGFLELQRSAGPSSGASPRNGGRRVFFPAPKRVSFRTTLEEEITNHRFTARHIDLSSSEDEENSGDESSDASKRRTTSEGVQNHPTFDQRVITPSDNEDTVLGETAEPRGSSAKGDAKESSPGKQKRQGNRIRKQTRLESGRRRRRRRWEWTLTPLDDDGAVKVQLQAPKKHEQSELGLSNPSNYVIEALDTNGDIAIGEAVNEETGLDGRHDHEYAA